MSLVVGLSLPLISYKVKEIVNIPARIEYEETTSMPMLINSSSTPLMLNTPIEESFNWYEVLQGVYALGIILMILKLLYSFKNIFKLIIEEKSKKSKKSTNLTNPNSDNFYISTQTQYANSSFFNLIFIDDTNLSEHEIRQILEHEKWHIRLYHSCDLLFVEILKIAFWFNPILWLYQRSLSEVHEYEVDSRMIQTHNPQVYAQLLLKLAIAPQLAMTHQFSRKPLTDRIHFLFTKQKSTPMKRLAYLSILPILGAFFMAFSVEKVVDYQEVEKPDEKYFKVFKKPDAEVNNEVLVKENKVVSNLVYGKNRVALTMNPDKVSAASIDVATKYFKNIGFDLDIHLFMSLAKNKKESYDKVEFILTESKENKKKYRSKITDNKSDLPAKFTFDLKKMKGKKLDDIITILADRSTGEHFVASLAPPPPPPAPPKAPKIMPPAPPKPPLPPVKIGMMKKGKSDKVGEVMINNQIFFTSIDKKGVTKIYNRFGVKVNEEGKALTLKDIPKVGVINSVKARNINATGLIVDSETLLPVNDAELYDDNNQLLGKTNTDGFFDIRFDVNKEGEIRFKLLVKKDGYAKFVQGEHWGDLQSNLEATYYFGLKRKWSNVQPFSELVPGKKYTNYESIQDRFSFVKEELDFEKKIENMKKNNSLLVHKIDNDYYLISDSGWIKMNSENDKIMVNGDKIFSVDEINSQVKRSRVKGMSPIQSKNASFEIQVSRF